ncbi:cysteine-rich motor neuron 1 protein-like isoform X1 [Anopheles aquasalis]|uniref:cysteine-rich motor neuron 1 protein-like isoform X1 n=1 Tax=Anopheles aquasalis TaxID=42839 RepID=UPI00215A2BE5|nr:cysteine-rich motor neuron 1 protein-like isoform X1 [Anopheles aquasalis]XP_050090289.1 cysteine-rich motor neuron 1 protein-like isoform X1 [Anopheles aquasalis]XP_050090290.1 cysteine-rich motor neuron 1 protein-like isoform X1 [Anopheles aquasalis]
MASRSDVRKLGTFWPFWWLVPVVLVLLLLPTSCIAREEPITDVDHLCQHVQCSLDCPDDSYLQSKEEYLATESDGTDGLRHRRAIAMNNHPQESIKIVPSATVFFPHNQLQPARTQRHFWKRSLPAGSIGDLHEMCCPKCMCRPCPVPRCPPNFTPAFSSAETALRQPGNCCPDVYCKELPQPLKRCYSKNFPGRSYGEGEEWNEDPCTQCKCEDGESRCQVSACRPLSCPRKRRLPDRCCPVCDEEGSIFCQGHVNCPVSCRHGYQREGSCYLCQCALPAVNGTIVPPPSPPTVTSTEAVPAHHPATADKKDPANRDRDKVEEKEELDIGGSFAPPPTPVEPSSRTPTYLYIFLLALCVCIALIAVAWYCIKNRRSCRGKYSTVPVSTSTITPTTTIAATTTPTLIAPVKVNSAA